MFRQQEKSIPGAYRRDILLVFRTVTMQGKGGMGKKGPVVNDSRPERANDLSGLSCSRTRQRTLTWRGKPL